MGKENMLAVLLQMCFPLVGEKQTTRHDKEVRDFIDQDVPSQSSDVRANIEMKSINRWDVGSVESSDTYASCNTQPFASQGDLTQLEAHHNLYINPLDDHHRSFQQLQSRVATVVSSSADGSPIHHHVVRRGPPLAKNLSGSSSTDSGSVPDDASPSHSPLRKPRFLQGIRPKPRFDDSVDATRSTVSANPSSVANKPRVGLKSPFPSIGKSGSKTSLHSDASDAHKSPEVGKKKSILKKGDSLHKEETEKLIPNPSSSEEVNVACQQSNGMVSPPLAASSSNRQPLKAIGPKMGTKPPAQPIKFVGVDPYQGTGSLEAEDVLCCANKGCALNKVAAQSYLSAVVCLCGSHMEMPSVGSGDEDRHSGSSSPTEETKLLGGEEEERPKMSRQSSKESGVPTT